MMITIKALAATFHRIILFSSDLALMTSFNTLHRVAHFFNRMTRVLIVIYCRFVNIASDGGRVCRYWKDCFKISKETPTFF